MIAFIDDHRGAYGVEPICKVLPIAPSTYRAHAARHADPAKQPSRAKLDLSNDIGNPSRGDAENPSTPATVTPRLVPVRVSL